MGWHSSCSPAGDQSNGNSKPTRASPLASRAFGLRKRTKTGFSTLEVARAVIAVSLRWALPTKSPFAQQILRLPKKQPLDSGLIVICRFLPRVEIEMPLNIDGDTWRLFIVHFAMNRLVQIQVIWHLDVPKPGLPLKNALVGLTQIKILNLPTGIVTPDAPCHETVHTLWETPDDVTLPILLPLLLADAGLIRNTSLRVDGAPLAMHDATGTRFCEVWWLCVTRTAGIMQPLTVVQWRHPKIRGAEPCGMRFFSADVLAIRQRHQASSRVLAGVQSVPVAPEFERVEGAVRVGIVIDVLAEQYIGDPRLQVSTLFSENADSYTVPSTGSILHFVQYLGVEGSRSDNLRGFDIHAGIDDVSISRCTTRLTHCYSSMKK
jgi:hypothetical protein